MEYRFKSSPAEELKRHGLKIDIFEGIEAKDRTKYELLN